MQTVSTGSIFKNFINNEWRDSSSQKTIGSTNPSNKEEVVGFVQNSTKEDLDQAVQAAEDAKVAWRKAGKVKRAEYLYKAADILESRIDEIGETMAREMGKTLPESKGETARGVAILRYYAGEGMRKDGDVIPSTDSGALMFTKRVPVGVVGVITPWNFPVAIPIWKMAPALIYGNTIAFKPATEAAVTAAKVIECFAEAGIPEGVINFVTGSGSVVGQALIDHPKVQALTFTGSGNVGEGVAKSAAARGVKFQLEMGGKNPVIVTKDADLDLTIQEVVSGAFRSTGQKCTATSRVIVEEAIYDQFVDQLIEETKKIKVGNAVEDGVWMGPSAHEQQFNTVKEYLEIGKNEGATVLAGGDVLTGNDYDKGFFVSPTIFGDVDPTMRIAKEEIFGPVIALFKASDLEDAIQQANDTEFGLSASIFTKDISSILEFIDEIEVGLVRINAESAGVELQAPFGGMKSTSTGGREQGQAAKEFYTETKTVFIKG